MSIESRVCLNCMIQTIPNAITLATRNTAAHGVMRCLAMGADCVHRWNGDAILAAQFPLRFVAAYNARVLQIEQHAAGNGGAMGPPLVHLQHDLPTLTTIARRFAADFLERKCPYPNCRMAWRTYDGCSAVTCRLDEGPDLNLGCHREFCGICLATCAQGTGHRHCREQHGDMFFTSAQIQQTHHVLFTSRLVNFLSSFQQLAGPDATNLLLLQFNNPQLEDYEPPFRVDDLQQLIQMEPLNRTREMQRRWLQAVPTEQQGHVPAEIDLDHLQQVDQLILTGWLTGVISTISFATVFDVTAAFGGALVQIFKFAGRITIKLFASANNILTHTPSPLSADISF